MNYKYFISLLESNDNKLVSKTQCIKDWISGFLVIKDNLVNISSNTYIKRNKIYN